MSSIGLGLGLPNVPPRRPADDEPGEPDPEPEAVRIVAPAASGSPNNDPWQDASTDPTQPDANSGWDDLLVIGGDVLMWIAIDLTDYAGEAVGIGKLSILMQSFEGSTADVELRARSSDSQPFNETELTYNNAPTAPTTLVFDDAVPATGETHAELSIDLSGMLGKWAVLTLKSVQQMLVWTRGLSDESERPVLEFDYLPAE